MDIHRTVAYSDIYGEHNYEVSQYLSSINIDRKELIKVCLHFIYSANIKSDIYSFCNCFFCTDNSDFRNDFIAKYILWSNQINPIAQTLQTNTLVSPISLHTALEMLRICFSLNEQSSLTSTRGDSKTEIEQQILKAVLLVNESLGKSEYNTHIVPSSENLNTAIGLCTNQIAYNDFTNINDIEKLLVAFNKAEMLFEFLDKTEIGSELTEDFITLYNCGSWLEYLFVIAKYYVLSKSNTNSYTTILLDEIDENYKRDLTILDNFAIHIDDNISLNDNMDYKVFKNKPLIKLSSTEFIVINNILCLDKAYTSIFFSLKDIYSKIKQKQYPEKSRKNIDGDFFRYYTSDFSEEEMFYGVIGEIFYNYKYIVRLSEKECKEINNQLQGEPDYYIRINNDIFLFEFKDKLIQGDRKASQDTKSVVEMINEKFIVNDGVRQLVNNIERIVNGEFVYDPQIKSTAVNIYPILVIGDSRFDVAGFNFWLNEELKDSLQSNGANINNKIKPLTVVTIDTLILYKNEFNEGFIRFKNIIKQYHQYLTYKDNAPKTKEILYRVVFQKYFPFSQFIKKQKIRSKQKQMDSIIYKMKKNGLK